MRESDAEGKRGGRAGIVRTWETMAADVANEGMRLGGFREHHRYIQAWRLTQIALLDISQREL